MTDYKFATDSESGTIAAESFESASRKLDVMVAGSDGGSGWVEDVDGYRYETTGDHVVFAVTNANGPISVAVLVPTSEAGAWLRSQSCSFVDDGRTDAEDHLGFCGDGMTADQFSAELTARGYHCVEQDLFGDQLWSLWVR